MSEIKTVEAQNPVYADAKRQMEKTNKLKATTTKVENTPKRDEKPKRPKMAQGAKKMHLDESLFENVSNSDNRKSKDVNNTLTDNISNSNNDLKESSISRNARRITATPKTGGSSIKLIKDSNGWSDGIRYYSNNFLRNNYNITIDETDPNYKPNRTKEIKVLQGNYGYGWDDLIEYDISDFNGDINAVYKEIRNDLIDYRENESVLYRVITRRVPVESLKEDWDWDGDKVKIADEMENAFARKDSITRDDFDEQFALAARKVLGIDNIWELQETPIKIDGKEEDIFDIETDIRTILSMSGWETVFEGENEGGLQKLTEALNEGAGAGYTVQGELYDIKVNHIENMDIYKAKSAFDVELDFAKVKVDADARFSGTVAGYYDGVELEDAIVKVTELEINPNILRYLGLEEFNYGEITAEDLESQFGSVIKFESDVIGGGWAHVTFDGNVKASKVDDDYTPFVDGVTFHFVNQEDIDYADRGLQGISDDDIDYDYADDMEDGYWEDKFNESLDSELADTFSYTYGISKSEARKRVAGLSKEEKQKKLDLLKNGIKRNAKADFYETQPSKLTEGAKSFLRTLGRDDIQYFTHKNRFNYDIKQIRIDNKNKTYEYGNFAWTNRQESTQNGKEFERLVDKLKEMGYTEIKKSLKERLTKRK